MKKEIINGVIYLTSEVNPKYINKFAALMAAQKLTIQLGMSTDNQVHLAVNQLRNQISVTIHFDLGTYPKVNPAYKYTWSEISSHTFWSDFCKKNLQVRTKTFYFEW